MSKIFKKIPTNSILFFFVIMILLVFSTSHSYVVSYYKKYKIENFQEAQEKAFTIFEDKLNSYVYGLQGIAGVFRAIEFKFSPNIIKDYALSRNYFQNFEGALGYGIIRSVSDADNYLKEIRKNDINFQIKNIGNLKNKIFIIETIEPIERNKPAIGLNVASELKRYEAAMNALEKKIPIITSEIKLVQDNEKKEGYLIFLPIFKNPNLQHLENELIGFAYSPILASSVYEYLEKRINIDFRLEISQVDSKHYFFNSLKNEVPIYEKTKTILGKKWVWRSLKSFSKEIRLVFLASLLIHFLLLVIIVFGLHRYMKNLKFINEELEKNAKLESWFSAILNATELSIISTDQNGIIKTFNLGAEKLLGYDASFVIDRFTPAFIHDLDEVTKRAQSLSSEINEKVEIGFDVFIKKIKPGKADINDWTYLHKNGEKIPVRLSVSSVLIGDQIIGYVGIAEDLRQVRKLNELIELQKIQILEKSRLSSLGEMASGVAHEINNPITAINGLVALIQKKIDRNQISLNEVSIDLQRINDLTLRVSKIILGLRLLARDSSEDPFVDFEIDKVINDALSICQTRFSENGIVINLEVESHLRIKMIPTQVCQVVLNLLINSFDSILDLENRWITIKVEKGEAMVLIRVVDSGLGIPNEIVHKIMNPFFTTKDLGKGTGLGLSVSRSIVQKHKGRLYYQLHNGVNTSFIIELPI